MCHKPETKCHLKPVQCVSRAQLYRRLCLWGCAVRCHILAHPPTRVCLLLSISAETSSRADRNSKESAPLLSHHRDDRNTSFFSALFHPSRQLNNLEKILVGIAVILLLFLSTFIGLFAGSQSKLGQERGKHEAVPITETLTATATTTVSSSPTGSPRPVSFASVHCALTKSALRGCLGDLLVAGMRGAVRIDSRVA